MAERRVRLSSGTPRSRGEHARLVTYLMLRLQEATFPHRERALWIRR
jgi:hypothetical protein